MLRRGANERIRVFHPIEVQLRLFLPFRAFSLLPSTPLLFPISYFGLFQSSPYTYSSHFVSLGVDFFPWHVSEYFLFLLGHRPKSSPASLIVFSSVVSNLSFRFLADCLCRRFFIRGFLCRHSLSLPSLRIPGFC